MNELALKHSREIKELSSHLVSKAEDKARIKHPKRLIGWYVDVIARKLIIDEFAEIMSSASFKKLIISYGLILTNSSVISKNLIRSIINAALFSNSHE